MPCRKQEYMEDCWRYISERKQSLWDLLLEQGYSKKLAQVLCKERLVWVDDACRDSRYMVPKGAEVIVHMLEESLDYEPIEMPLHIVYEDVDVLVVDKPSGITVNSMGQLSLANGIAFYFLKRGLKRKIRFINRLDQDTSGYLMIAKHSLAQACYQRQMETGDMRKEYETIVEGLLEGEGTLILPMRRKENGIGNEVHKDGTPTETRYRSQGVVTDDWLSARSWKVHEEHGADSCKSIVAIDLITGKNHQIRVAMSYIGHPLVGDALYGGRGSDGFYLRSRKLMFKALRTNDTVTICDGVVTVENQIARYALGEGRILYENID